MVLGNLIRAALRVQGRRLSRGYLRHQERLLAHLILLARARSRRPDRLTIRRVTNADVSLSLRHGRRLVWRRCLNVRITRSAICTGGDVLRPRAGRVRQTRVAAARMCSRSSARGGGSRRACAASARPTALSKCGWAVSGGAASHQQDTYSLWRHEDPPFPSRSKRTQRACVPRREICVELASPGKR